MGDAACIVLQGSMVRSWLRLHQDSLFGNQRKAPPFCTFCLSNLRTAKAGRFWPQVTCRAGSMCQQDAMVDVES